jgi:hypothetical protein
MTVRADPREEDGGDPVVIMPQIAGALLASVYRMV